MAPLTYTVVTTVAVEPTSIDELVPRPPTFALFAGPPSVTINEVLVEM